MAPPVDTAQHGLTSEEALRRLRDDGPNQLPRPKAPSHLGRFVHQLVHFFALLLWGACLLAILGGLPELSVAIALVVLLNAVFAYGQEAKASRAAERLRDLLPHQVAVQRDGLPTMVDAIDVVVGDLLLLEAGDRIPADGLIVRAAALQLDTSLLTGESETVRAESGDEVHAGTFVVEGEAQAVVRATGASTRLADIARLTTGTPPPASPLTIELGRVVRTIAWIAVGVGGSFFAISVLLGIPLSEGFVFGIGVTVALGARGPLADRHAEPGVGGGAHGRPPGAGTEPRSGGDPRVDDVRVHRQDGDADTERDDRRPCLDPHRGSGDRRPRV